jgi:hypothetical protein
LLRRTPEIAPAAVEELLRFDAPLQWLTRVAACDVELHERTIPAGSRVALIWASANRDERRWPDAEELMPQIVDYELAGPVTRLYTQTERTITSLPTRAQWSVA